MVRSSRRLTGGGAGPTPRLPKWMFRTSAQGSRAGISAASAAVVWFATAPQAGRPIGSFGAFRPAEKPTRLRLDSSHVSGSEQLSGTSPGRAAPQPAKAAAGSRRLGLVQVAAGEGRAPVGRHPHERPSAMWACPDPRADTPARTRPAPPSGPGNRCWEQQHAANNAAGTR